MGLGMARRDCLYFGTVERHGWFPTPNRGADTSSTGWSVDGTDINGGGYVFNSWNSHRRYVFEWPGSSAMDVAQRMRSYADGSFGRGPIYFQDPLTYETNVLPAQWADPSMTIGNEGQSLVAGVEPVGMPGSLEGTMPVRAASYDLSSVTPGFRGTSDAVFVLIPEGYTLNISASYSSTGTGGVFIVEQAQSGGVGAPKRLAAGDGDTGSAPLNLFSGVAGVWLYLGRSSTASSSVTVRGMVGRLIPTASADVRPVVTQFFTNPNLVGDGTFAEVRRNLAVDPSFTSLRKKLGTATNSMSPGGGATLSVDSSWSEYGDTSLRISAGNNSSAAYVSWAGAGEGMELDVWGGKTITIAATIRLDAVVDDLAPTANTPPHSIAVYTDIGGVRNWAHAYSESAEPVPGVTRLKVTFTLPTGTSTDFWGVRLFNGSSSHYAWWDGLTVEEGVTDGSYFDDTVSPDPDMRCRFLGAAPFAQSVLEIERVASYYNARAVVGVSSQDGVPAMRIIPTDPTSNNSYARYTIPAEARAGGTLIGTLHQEEPLTGGLFSARNRTLFVQNPAHLYPIPPNEPQSTEMRLSFGQLTSSFYTMFMHGGYPGSGDVWWTNVGLFAGDYNGPWFSGDSSAFTYNGQMLKPQWDGEPNNSTSTAYTTSREIEEVLRKPWIGGQGNSGVRFAQKPTLIENTGVNGGQVGFAASFIEVGGSML